MGKTEILEGNSFSDFLGHQNWKEQSSHNIILRGNCIHIFMLIYLQSFIECFIHYIHVSCCWKIAVQFCSQTLHQKTSWHCCWQDWIRTSSHFSLVTSWQLCWGTSRHTCSRSSNIKDLTLTPLTSRGTFLQMVVGTVLGTSVQTCLGTVLHSLSWT